MLNRSILEKPSNEIIKPKIAFPLFLQFTKSCLFIIFVLEKFNSRTDIIVNTTACEKNSNKKIETFPKQNVFSIIWVDICEIFIQKAQKNLDSYNNLVPSAKVYAWCDDKKIADHTGNKETPEDKNMIPVEHCIQ